MRFTPNGLSVRARSRRIPARRAGGGFALNDMMPRPPALLTAAASSGPVTKPIGARMIGSPMPRRSQSGVRKVMSRRTSLHAVPDEEENHRADHGEEEAGGMKGCLALRPRHEGADEPADERAEDAEHRG